MFRIPIVALLALGIVACSNPLPFGPGRVDIALERVTVRSMDHAALFPSVAPAHTAQARNDVLELIISSRVELISYFAQQERVLQVRCEVQGNTNGRRYTGIARTPVPIATAPSAPYRYAIHAFIDLKADDAEFAGGSPASTLNLKTDNFTSLSCHLLGVMKAPGLYPRSNDILVSDDTFRALLRQASD